MKYILTVVLALMFTACNQEQAAEVSAPALETQAVENVKKVEVTPVETETKTPEPQIEVQVESGKEVTKAVQPVVKVMPKAEVQASQDAKVVEGVAVAKVETVMFEPVQSEVVMIKPVQAKMVAQPMQGKGEIRSEPKVTPKSGLMLKETSGDAVAGKKIAKKCMSCHTFDDGGKKKMGPNLFAIVGKTRGISSSFKYGSYLASVGGSWDEGSLKAWVTDSKGIAKAAGKKTKMASQKIKGKKADDLIAYLKTLK